MIGGGADTYTPPTEVTAMSKKAQLLNALLWRLFL
jgi:hypothetical protein